VLETAQLSRRDTVHGGDDRVTLTSGVDGSEERFAGRHELAGIGHFRTPEAAPVVARLVTRFASR